MRDRILIVVDDADFIDQPKASYSNYFIKRCNSILPVVKRLSDSTYDFILPDLMLTPNIDELTGLTEFKTVAEPTLFKHIGNKGKTAKELALSIDQLRYRLNKLAPLFDDFGKLFPTINKCYFRGKHGNKDM